MNKLTLNIGLSLVFSTSLLVSHAQANTTVDPDVQTNQTQTHNKDAATDQDETTNQGYTQVVNQPLQQGQQDQTQTQKKKEKSPEKTTSKVQVQTQTLTSVLNAFLGRSPESGTTDTEDVPVPTSNPSPTQAPTPPDETESPEAPVVVHHLQGVLLDITSSSILVRYKSFQQLGTKSKSAAKRSLAKMVKSDTKLQIMSFDIEKLDPSALESLENKLFEECKFRYEMDETGARFVTGIN